MLAFDGSAFRRSEAAHNVLADASSSRLSSSPASTYVFRHTEVTRHFTREEVERLGPAEGGVVARRIMHLRCLASPESPSSRFRR